MEFFDIQNNRIVFNSNVPEGSERDFWKALRKENLSDIKIVDCSDAPDSYPLWEERFERIFPDAEEVILPEKLKTLKEGQFAGLKNLKKIHLPSDLEILPESLFRGCENLTEIQIPDSVKKISWNCFADSGLKEVEIPSSVEIICEGAFVCPELEIVKFSPRLKIIEPNSFVGEKIKELRFPDSLEQIGDTYLSNGIIDLSECSKITKIDGDLKGEMVIMPPNLEVCNVRFQKDSIIFFGNHLSDIKAAIEHGEIYFFSNKIKSFKEIESSRFTTFYVPESSISKYSKLKVLERKEEMKIEELPVQFKFFWL